MWLYICFSKYSYCGKSVGKWFHILVRWECSNIFTYTSIPHSIFARGSRLALENNHGSPIIPHVNVDCLDYSYPRLKTCNSELILCSYDYIPVAQETMNSVI